MNTRTKILSGVALSGALLFLGVTAVHSQPPGGGRGGFGGFGGHGHHGGPGGGPAMFLLHGLDLTDDQESQIKALHEAQEETIEAQSEALGEARKALHQMVLSGTYTEAAAAPYAAQIGTASAEMARLHAKLGSEIYNLLTPEQRTEISERMAKFEEHGGLHGRR
jgi:protein CpxP